MNVTVSKGGNQGVSFYFGDVVCAVLWLRQAQLFANVRCSAQTLLLALSFKPHPATTLSPALQPW